MRVGLISCCKEKLDHPAPAKELYKSHLFRLSMEFISRGRADEWAILSAKYGLVMPDQVIEPYNVCLNDFCKEEHSAWKEMVQQQLIERWGEQTIWLILAGANYRSAVWGMPMVEDVIAHWTRQRKERGMSNRKAAMSIGVIKKYLKEGRSFY